MEHYGLKLLKYLNTETIKVVNGPGLKIIDYKIYLVFKE